MKISRKLACGILAAGLTFMGASSASADDVPSQTEVVATSEAVVPAASDVVDTPPAPEPAEETVAPTVTAEEAPAPADVPEPVAPVAEPEQPAQVTPAESVAPVVDIPPAPEPDDATPPVLASLVKPNFFCNAGVGTLTWLVTGDPNNPNWVGRVIGQNIATTPTFVGGVVQGESKSLTGQQLDFQVGVDYQLRPTIRWLRDGDPTGLPYYSTYGGTVRPFSCIVEIPSTPEHVDPPNTVDKVIPPTWKDPLPADTDKVDWSESADGSTRTATLIIDGSTWTDDTTAPKVSVLPSDNGVVVVPPVIVVEIPSTPGHVDQPNKQSQVIPPNSEGPLPAGTDQNSLNESADGSTLTATPKLPGESFVQPIGLGIALALGILVLLVAWRRRRQERR